MTREKELLKAIKFLRRIAKNLDPKDAKKAKTIAKRLENVSESIPRYINIGHPILDEHMPEDPIDYLYRPIEFPKKKMMDIETLERAMRESWNKDTCYPPWANKWTFENPARGQCAVTALIVQDYFGGELLYCRRYNHYWNKLPNQKEVDFTRCQFPVGTVLCIDGIETRDHVLNSESAIRALTSQRYQLLKNRVEEKLNP